ETAGLDAAVRRGELDLAANVVRRDVAVGGPNVHTPRGGADVDGAVRGAQVDVDPAGHAQDDPDRATIGMEHGVEVEAVPEAVGGADLDADVIAGAVLLDPDSAGRDPPSLGHDPGLDPGAGAALELDAAVVRDHLNAGSAAHVPGPVPLIGAR